MHSGDGQVSHDCCGKKIGDCSFGDLYGMHARSAVRSGIRDGCAALVIIMGDHGGSKRCAVMRISSAATSILQPSEQIHAPPVPCASL